MFYMNSVHARINEKNKTFISIKNWIYVFLKINQQNLYLLKFISLHQFVNFRFMMLMI